MAKAYRHAAEAFGLGPRSGVDPASRFARRFRGTQTDWLRRRDGCGLDVACLSHAYAQRLAVRAFHADPDVPGPITGFLGRYTDGRSADGVVMQISARAALVRFTDVEATSGRWVCDFTGIGEVGEDIHRLVVRPAEPMGQEDGRYTVTLTATGLQIADDDGARAVEANWCGMNGAIDPAMRRVP